MEKSSAKKCHLKLWFHKFEIHVFNAPPNTNQQRAASSSDIDKILSTEVMIHQLNSMPFWLTKSYYMQNSHAKSCYKVHIHFIQGRFEFSSRMATITFNQLPVVWLTNTQPVAHERSQTMNMQNTAWKSSHFWQKMDERKAISDIVFNQSSESLQPLSLSFFHSFYLSFILFFVYSSSSYYLSFEWIFVFVPHKKAASDQPIWMNKWTFECI